MDEPASDRDERLARLLEQLQVLQDRGEFPDIAAVAAGDPDLVEELRGLWGTVLLAEGCAKSEPPSRGLAAASAIHDPPNVGSVPRAIGDYDVLRELGRGGMGVVYLARQRGLDRLVALKQVLHGTLASPEDRERFRSEARAAAQLHHAHIVPVFEVGDVDGVPYFSMQYLPGSSLAAKVANGPLPAREAAEILAPICRAIAEAHARGVLHRDLKPSNILLDESGRPFVVDFGLAKRIDAELTGGQSTGRATHRTLTQTGAVLGTPAYMAPEQAAGDRGRIGPATDVYALGAVLYAMLTGRAPFQGTSPIDTVLMVLEQDPPAPRLLNPRVDRDLEMIALKALQKPADLRYATAAEMADDLEKFLRGEPPAARSSHFTQILSRAFRPTHHVAVLENWGLLWMWHAVVVLLISVVTNVLQLRGVDSRWTYVLLWTVGLGTWAGIFWELRRRAGPVTFVERQVAHVWASSMAMSTGLFVVEGLLGLPPLTLSPVLALIAGAVFIAKAGILSGEFYIPAAALFLAAIPMAIWPTYAITMFGIASGLAFFLPGLKFFRQRRQSMQTK
jgi:serine/threonine protein kinase